MKLPWKTLIALLGTIWFPIAAVQSVEQQAAKLPPADVEAQQQAQALAFGCVRAEPLPNRETRRPRQVGNLAHHWNSAVSHACAGAGKIAADLASWSDRSQTLWFAVRRASRLSTNVAIVLSQQVPQRTIAESSASNSSVVAGQLAKPNPELVLPTAAPRLPSVSRGEGALSPTDLGHPSTIKPKQRWPAMRRVRMSRASSLRRFAGRF